MENLKDEDRDDDVVENNLDFNTDSEVSADDSDDSVRSIRRSQERPNYVGKDHNSKISHTWRHNIITKLPGVTSVAKCEETNTKDI